MSRKLEMGSFFTILEALDNEENRMKKYPLL